MFKSLFIIFFLQHSALLVVLFNFLKVHLEWKTFLNTLRPNCSFWQLLNFFGRVIGTENNRCFNNSYLSALIAESEEKSASILVFREFPKNVTYIFYSI